MPTPAPHKQPHQTQWEKIKLGDIAEIDPKEKIKKGVKAKKISMGDIISFYKFAKFSSFENFKSGSKFRNGDILLAKITPCLENGKTAFVDCLEKGEVAFGSSEFIVFRATKMTDSHFLYYTLTAPNFRKTAIQSMTGTSGRKRVQNNIITQYQVSLPPLPIQKNIAQILSTLDKKIELNTRINTELESMAKLLYTRYFVEFNFPDSSGKPYKASGGAMVYSPTLKREIPKDWEVAKIGDLCSIQSGFAFSTKDFSSQGIYKLITIKNVKDGFISIDTDNKILMLPTKLPTFCRLKKGDILLSLTGNVGRVGMVWDTDLLLNQRVGIIQEKEANKSFLYCLFRSEIMKTTLENLASGTSQHNLSPILTEKLWTLKPKKEILNKFHNEVSTILESILINQQESQRLAEWRDYLLPLLMGDQAEVV